MNRQQRKRINTIDNLSCDPDNIAKAIAIAEQCGQPGMAELLRHVRCGAIQVVRPACRSAEIEATDFSLVERPAVWVVGDDDYQSTGPSGWRCAQVVSEWARSAVIHASAATAETYIEAVYAARVTGRCALIETDAQHAASWAEIFNGKSTLMILPTGGVHPVVPGPDEIQ